MVNDGECKQGANTIGNRFKTISPNNTPKEMEN